ncbi:MAG: glycosyltransferase [Candidatus Krumholzibacteria bacterium]|nr:glycosyltransferase [Candidatus Krumholzibacteria bacterium]
MKVVCFSEIQWHYLRTRKQQVLSRFPSDWEILFLSSVVKGKPNNFLPRREGRVVHVCVPVFKNFPQRPVRLLFSLPPVRLLWNVVLFLWLNLIFLATGFSGKNRVFYVSNIYYAAVLPFLARTLMLYDCNDDHLAFPHTPSWARGYFVRVVRSADLAIAVSTRLVRMLREAGAADVHLVGNGVDYELFRAAAESGIPDDMAALERPIIGYSGAVAQWFDFDLLDSLAESFPHASIAIVGPVFRERAGEFGEIVSRRGNVFHLGSKPYERLGAYIAAMDVCIIPLVVNELRRSADPNKLYEYAACGRPVVTRKYSDDLEPIRGLIHLADSGEEFIDQIHMALASGANREKLTEFARSRDWQVRADEIVSLIRESVARKRALRDAGGNGGSGRRVQR